MNAKVTMSVDISSLYEWTILEYNQTRFGMNYRDIIILLLF